MITGASSGIGRAAALEFARHGTRLVLAARRREALQETAHLCARRGARVLTVVTDVTSHEDMDNLVTTTLATWDRIDIWVNNAGTTLFGRLHEGQFAEHRRVIETNLLAPMYAARLVMPIFRRQGAGTLINVGSVLSQVGNGFVPAYAISKFGLRGLTEALRSDVADERAIHVCTLLPYAVDTPHFEDGGNAIGRRPFAMPPAQSPEHVARALVRLARRPRRQSYVPKIAAAGIALHWMWPRFTERLLRHALERFHMVGRQPETDGALFASRPTPGTIHGSRAPIVSTPVFALWLLMDLGRMGTEWWRGRAVR